MGFLDRLGLRRPPSVDPVVVNLADTLNTSLGERKTQVTGKTTGYTAYKELSDQAKKNILISDPIIHKGVYKKARQCFQEWFTIDSPLDGVDVPEEIEKQLTSFYQDISLKRTLMQNMVHVLYQGNGYMELVTTDTGEADTPLPENVELINVVNVDPCTILREKQTLQGDPDTEYFVQRTPHDKIRIHPSRIIHTTLYTLGDSVFGTSVIDVAHLTAQSKLNGDKAVGEILYRFSHPFPVITIGDDKLRGTKTEIKKGVEVLQKINPETGFVGSERYAFDLLNPSSIMPDEYANWFYINYAAALEIPWMILVGVQKGSVTGSEVDLAEYYKDIASIQNTLYTPVINQINKMLIGDQWEYEIFWNPLYVDEKTEAETRKNNMESIKYLMDCGLLSDIEARQIAREWNIPIPEDPPWMKDEPPEEDEPVSDIPSEDEVLPVRPATDKEIAAHKRLSRLELQNAEKERELGRRILREWEKEDANRPNKDEDTT